MLKGGSRKGRRDRSRDEKKALVESFLARMEVAVEMDLEANTKGQPAINKLKLVPELEATLCQRDLHDEFLDGGVLGVLKAWIEPMPDGSLPNLKVRSAVLRVLHQLNFFFEDRKEQLKKSGLGRVVMFLYKLPDETPANRRLAKELVEKWSRPIFEQYRDSRGLEEGEQQADERREGQARARESGSAHPRGADDEELEGGRSALKPGDPGFRWHASIPQAARLDYRKMPGSAVAADPVAVQKAARKDKMTKKLEGLARKKTQQKAAHPSVEGRNLVM